MSISRKFACALALLTVGAALCGAQTITTADTFFSSVSETYAKVTDFSANIEIVSQSGTKNQAMKGRSVFKSPNLLRIDFSDPDEQTIVFDGDMLTIYLPTYNVVLSQSVEGNSSSSGAALATPEGLALMKRYYTIAYETGPAPVPLEENSPETVVVLALARRYTTEMFRTIRLMVSPESKLIRRIEAMTITGDKITFSFSGYSLNQGIQNSRFLYESPASANVFNDFLFNEE